jgi:hypothetical protein
MIAMDSRGAVFSNNPKRPPKTKPAAQLSWGVPLWLFGGRSHLRFFNRLPQKIRTLWTHELTMLNHFRQNHVNQCHGQVHFPSRSLGWHQPLRSEGVSVQGRRHVAVRLALDIPR